MKGKNWEDKVRNRELNVRVEGEMRKEAKRGQAPVDRFEVKEWPNGCS